MRPMSLVSIEAEFLRALAEHGIAPAKALVLKADGRIHRYRVEGDKSGSTNGWYVLYPEGTVPAGAFGSWKTGVSGTWCARSERDMTPQEKEDLRRKMQEAQQSRADEQERVWAEARKKSARLLSIAGTASANHPYLLKKGVRSYGLRQLRKMLVIPIRSADGAVMSLQFIHQDGSKRFLTGGQVAGGYYAIGKPKDILLICEGYATGASLYEATGYAVAVAFSTGNLLPVTMAMREKFPALKIVICADNDQATEGNPGLNKAEGAAGQGGGMVSVPTFDANESIDGKMPKDFNDLHRLRGLDAVRTAVQSASEKGSPIGAARTRKELEALIEATDDFDVLTDELVRQVADAGLARPAYEYLLTQIARKAGVPKSALLDVAEATVDRRSEKPPDKLSPEDEQVKWLNEKHAVLPIGGRVLVLNREWDPVQQKQLFTFSAKSDFETRYCNRKVYDRGEEVGLGTHWLNHPGRAEYDGMVFSPGAEMPGYLNLWSGWGVEPKPGSCWKYLGFVSEVICSGDESLFDYVVKWCAHLVQRPGELPETALVFRGREGIGKNTFVDALRDIVGREHYLLLSSMNQVTGRFSGHLANALLVFCNESVWGGDRSHQGVLKSMVTDDMQPVEYKGRDLMMLKSYRRMIFATNENWAVPRGEDDRRYVITDVSDARKGDYAYFQAIREEMRTGGTEALMQFLLEQDISGWHPRMIPDYLSQRGWELKIRSGGSIVQWWFDMLQQGWIEKIDAHYAEEDRLVWPERCLTEVLQNSYLKWCLNYKVTHPEHSVVLGKAIHDWGVKTARPWKDNPARRLFYKLPTLDDARSIFTKRFSIPQSVWSDHDDGAVYD
jgi:putative DNA primase/helicase